jgi:hypothetical protein
LIWAHLASCAAAIFFRAAAKNFWRFDGYSHPSLLAWAGACKPLPFAAIFCGRGGFVIAMLGNISICLDTRKKTRAKKHLNPTIVRDILS